ncbi:MAG: phytanoyl-CoA dioxygenase family protein [Chitinophagales bacterium]|nr:phytanoyl-CoA dioxygenase family protein [Chitinophagales bacterium]
MARLFLKEENERNFISDGYLVLPLLSEAEVKQLTELFSENYVSSEEGLVNFIRLESSEKRLALHFKIIEIVAPALNRYLKNYAFNVAHFISKTHRNSTEFRLHQDWTIVEESKYISAQVWIALQHTNKTNGGLFLIKGSHRFFNNYRSGSCGIVFIDSTDDVKKHIIDIELEAGEALFYHNSLFHGSYPNQSATDRIACLCGIRQANAPMRYYHKNSDNLIEEYNITTQQLIEYLLLLEKGLVPDDMKPDLVQTHLYHQVDFDTHTFEKILRKRYTMI